MGSNGGRGIKFLFLLHHFPSPKVLPILKRFHFGEYTLSVVIRFLFMRTSLIRTFAPNSPTPHRFFSNFWNVFCFSHVPTRWLLFNGSCFKEFKTRLNFTDAKQACDKMNSSLASIHSAQEHDFIYRHVLSKDSSPTFIGFDDIANEGTFEWSDGSAVTYTNWAGGNPDNFGQGQDCSVIATHWNGLWDDIACFNLRQFICRRKWCS